MNDKLNTEEKATVKPMLPVVFWAHFRSKHNESDRLERFKDGRNPVTIIEWISEQRKQLEDKYGECYCMTNCGVIS